MKKILSVILAVMMIFGTMAISASAAQSNASSTNMSDIVTGLPYQPTQSQVVLQFNLNGGKMMNSMPVYDSVSGWGLQDGITGIWNWIPREAGELEAGNSVTLPYVTPPSGSAFLGWQCNLDGKVYAVAPNGYTVPENAGGTVIQFTAYYGAAEPEADTMGTILGILIKVFGAIIGIILYGGDTEAGVAMMEKVLGGLDL